MSTSVLKGGVRPTGVASDGTRLAPRLVQQPRIPIWVGGAFTLRGPRARALRWDGAALYRIPPPDWEDLRPEDEAALGAAARPDFDIAVGGRERDEDEAAEREYLAAIAEAGATWWHEFLAPGTPEEAVREYIERGPLR